MSLAVTRDSCEVPNCLMTVGRAATAVNTINKGIMTAKADLRGIPQIL